MPFWDIIQRLGRAYGIMSREQSMTAPRRRPRLAVISPFLDKSHGSERIVVEWLTHLPNTFEIHIYSQHVEDLDLSRFTWHRIPKLPLPHLLDFLWWLAAGHLFVGWHRRFRGLRYDLIFSSGANYPGADVICVHIVFAEYVRQVRLESSLLRNPVWRWPRLLHRKLYYGVACLLENCAYPNPGTTLVVNSRKTARELTHHYRRAETIPVIYLGIDHSVFNLAKRAELRDAARRELEVTDDQLAIVLVGNDWLNKGVGVLLDAMQKLHELPLRLLIVSREVPSRWWEPVSEKSLNGRVSLLPPRKDIEFYYAAADIYAGPSLQDAYAMPAAEAMACGLPVIVSASTGVSEIVTNGVDGLILDDPRDAAALAAMIRRLYEDKDFRDRLGERAAETTRKYTWENNGRELAAIFEEILAQKSGFAARTLAEEP
jgi:glycosyltransferase involved in cell wall biosynthesis